MKHTIILLSAMALAACGNSSNQSGNDAGGGNADMAGSMPVTVGTALSPTANAWTWVDLPDTACDDGSPTGIAINGGTSTNLIVFFNGGGACWDYLTCFTLNTATHGPFGKAQFDAQVNTPMTGTLFDRTAADNPFKDYSFVFVPYCTGDVHTGDNIVDYGTAAKPAPYHHWGRHNVEAILPHLVATWPTPAKLVVSGSSAGGFGAAFNYDRFRDYWPASTTPSAYLIDDSGPILEGDSIPATYRDDWYTNWGLGAVLDPLCGDACKSDLSVAIDKIYAKHPNDRMALLSSEQDATIRTYFQLMPADFQTALNLLATDHLDPKPNFHYFFVAGETHTMLGDLGMFSQASTSISAWLGQEVNDDAAWKTLKPTN